MGEDYFKKKENNWVVNQALVQTLALGSLQTKTFCYRQMHSDSISSGIKFGVPGKSEVSMWDGAWRELVYFRAVEKVWVICNVCKQRPPLKGVR